MALSFNGLQPVRFGDRECAPKIDAETQLRLQSINGYGPETDEILASAFPDDAIYVREFMAKNMTTYEKEELHAYLLGGEAMLDNLRNTLTGVLKNGKE